MTGPHPDRLALLGYLEGDEFAREEITAELARCSACRAAFSQLQHLVTLLSDGSIFTHIAEYDSIIGKRERFAAQERVRAHAEREAAEAVAADEFFASLEQCPVETWQSELAAHPRARNGGIVRRILKASEVELDRYPKIALAMLQVGEVVAHGLEGGEATRRLLGDVWKQRSNAQRQLAEYEDAVDAAALAESFYASLNSGGFDVGQAQYTRAVAFFKMTRYREALDVLAESRATLQEFGPTLPLAKTLMLEAAIRYEQGDSATAATIWRDVMPVLQRFDEPLELARVRANLAACCLRLGTPDDALVQARIAASDLRALGNDVEEARALWTAATARLLLGEDTAVDELYDAAAAFESRGMVGDAGFVKLDIVAALLEQQAWHEAEILARELVPLFTNAGVTLASVTALDYLRQAVERRQATAAIVQYVRDFIERDDPTRPFLPPHVS
jgi:tetratricopeptide (TPR) repeat protein